MLFYSFIKLSFFSFSLLFQSSFLLLLLLKASQLKLLSLFCSSFCFKSIFLSGSSLVCLNGSLSSQSIKFSLSIGSFLLKFSQFLNFLFFLIFYSPSINILILLLRNYLSLFLSFFFNILSNLLFLIFFLGLSLLNNQNSIFVCFYDLFINFVLLYSFPLNIILLTSFCSSSSLSNSFIFCTKIWAYLYCSSFCLSLSIYRAFICSMITSFPLRASYFFIS